MSIHSIKSSPLGSGEFEKGVELHTEEKNNINAKVKETFDQALNAIVGDNIEKLAESLEKNPEVACYKDSLYGTLLHVFALYAKPTDKNKEPILDRLVEAGADINALSERNITPLTQVFMRHNSKNCDEVNLAKLLIDRGASVEVKKCKTSSIESAVEYSTLEAVDLLIENGANVLDNSTLIPRATGRGHLEILKRLIEQKASLAFDNIRASELFDFPYNPAVSLLSRPTTNGEMLVLGGPVFIPQGSRPHDKETKQEIRIILKESFPKLQIIPRKKVPADFRKSVSAILNHNLEEFSKRLENTPKIVGHRDHDGKMLIHWLERYLPCHSNVGPDMEKSKKLFEPMLKALVDAGADINAPVLMDGKEGGTLLWKALSEYDRATTLIPFLEALIEHGADLSDPTLVYQPVLRGDAEVVKLLIEKGFKVDSNRMKAEKTYDALRALLNGKSST